MARTGTRKHEEDEDGESVDEESVGEGGGRRNPRRKARKKRKLEEDDEEYVDEEEDADEESVGEEKGGKKKGGKRKRPLLTKEQRLADMAMMDKNVEESDVLQSTLPPGPHVRASDLAEVTNTQLDTENAETRLKWDPKKKGEMSHLKSGRKPYQVMPGRDEYEQKFTATVQTHKAKHPGLERLSLVYPEEGAEEDDGKPTSLACDQCGATDIAIDLRGTNPAHLSLLVAHVERCRPAEKTCGCGLNLAGMLAAGLLLCRAKKHLTTCKNESGWRLCTNDDFLVNIEGFLEGFDHLVVPIRGVNGSEVWCEALCKPLYKWMEAVSRGFVKLSESEKERLKEMIAAARKKSVQKKVVPKFLENWK